MYCNKNLRFLFPKTIAGSVFLCYYKVIGKCFLWRKTMVKEAPTPEQITDLLEKTVKKAKEFKAEGHKIRDPKTLIKDIDERDKQEKLTEKNKQKNLSKEAKAIEKAKEKLAAAQKKLEDAKAKNDKKAIEKAEKDVKKAKEA
jgi:hypothetical protein